MTRHGLLWRAHFWTTASHPVGEHYGGYYEWIRAWTPWGARRLARRHRHQWWDFSVERWRD